MSTLAPTLQAFFTDRLARQRRASGHTIAAYRDAVKLLLVFAERHTGKLPSDVDVVDLDAAPAENLIRPGRSRLTSCADLESASCTGLQDS